MVLNCILAEICPGHHSPSWRDNRQRGRCHSHPGRMLVIGIRSVHGFQREYIAVPLHSFGLKSEENH